MFALSLIAILSAFALLTPAGALPQAGTTLSLPLARRFNGTGGLTNILARDRARAKALYNRVVHPESHAEEKRYSSTNVREESPYEFMTYVNFGPAPGLVNNLMIDTSESITWIGAFRQYSSGVKGTATGRVQSITYGNGASYLGSEFKNRVGFDQSLVIDNYLVGVAERTVGFSGSGWMDGLLGLGPQSTSIGTILDNSTATVPNLIDSLYKASKLSSNVFSIFMPPYVSQQYYYAQGQLILGGINYGLASGTMSMVPLTTTYPASLFWGINQKITYGSQRAPIMSKTAGILDSCTTFTLLPSEAMKLYTTLIGAVFDTTLQMWYITPTQYANLQSLWFEVGAGDDLEFTANAQILPRALNTAVGGSADLIYLTIADIGYSSGEGLDFINGVTFLQRFYTSYDITDKVVGIAPTSYTYATTN